MEEVDIVIDHYVDRVVWDDVAIAQPLKVVVQTVATASPEACRTSNC